MQPRCAYHLIPQFPTRKTSSITWRCTDVTPLSANQKPEPHLAHTSTITSKIFQAHQWKKPHKRVLWILNWDIWLPKQGKFIVTTNSVALVCSGKKVKRHICDIPWENLCHQAELNTLSICKRQFSIIYDADFGSSWKFQIRGRRLFTTTSVSQTQQMSVGQAIPSSLGRQTFDMPHMRSRLDLFELPVTRDYSM